MGERVIEYVLRRLKDIGVDTVFGVPGDYAFSVQDAIVGDPALTWIGCTSELNAGYAADAVGPLPLRSARGWEQRQDESFSSPARARIR